MNPFGVIFQQAMHFSLSTSSPTSMARYDLDRAMARHRASIDKLSSGERIANPSEDSGALSVSEKMKSRLKRISRTEHNERNAVSFLDMQYGALQVAGSILTRMSELKTMWSDTTKNEGDRENYDKEFLELQKEFGVLSREKFNGISLFTSVEVTNHALQAYSGRNDSIGQVVSLARNFLKGEFAAASGAVLGEYKKETKDVTTTTTTTSTVNSPITTKAGATGINPDGSPIAVGATDLNWTVTGLSNSVVRYKHPLWANDSGTIGKWVGLSNGGVGNYLYSMSFDLTGVDLDDVQISGKAATDNAGRILLNGQDMGINFPQEFKALQAFSLQSTATGIVVDGTTTIPNVLVDGTNQITVKVSNAGGPTGMFFDDLQISGSRTTSTTTSTTAQVTTVTKIYPGLADFEQGEFAGFLENVTEAMAQVGAEKSRLNFEILRNNRSFQDLELAKSRITDTDVAQESTRLAKTQILIQSSANVISQANKLAEIALRFMAGK